MINWRRLAKCANDQINPELFFQADTDFQLKLRLRRVCRVCPVQRDCLDENLTVPFGMYGGMIWRERKAVMRRRGIKYVTAAPSWGIRLPSYDIGRRQRGRHGNVR